MTACFRPRLCDAPSAEERDWHGALVLARRAQLRNIRKMERHAAGAADRREETERLGRAAVWLEPTNWMVLSVAANAHLLIEDDVHAGLELARRAVDLNPANPFARDALSIRLAMARKPQEAQLGSPRVFAISQR